MLVANIGTARVPCGRRPEGHPLENHGQNRDARDKGVRPGHHRHRTDCLDTRGEPGDEAEVAIEVAAAFGRPGVPDRTPIRDYYVYVGPRSGACSGQLELVLDLLARVDFDPSAPIWRPRSTRWAASSCLSRVREEDRTGPTSILRAFRGGLRTHTRE